MENLHVRFIVEILGKPKDHVLQTMHGLVDKLSKEKGVTITHQTIHEPRLIKDSKELYTTFAEIEATFGGMDVFFGIVFAYTPSNIEIISPSNIKITNDELTALGNILIGRLHLYESVTKKLVGDRDILINRLKAAGVSFDQPLAHQPAPVKKEKSAPSKKKKKKR